MLIYDAFGILARRLQDLLLSYISRYFLPVFALKLCVLAFGLLLLNSDIIFSFQKEQEKNIIWSKYEWDDDTIKLLTIQCVVKFNPLLRTVVNVAKFH